jgi:hypothetical protein
MTTFIVVDRDTMTDDEKRLDDFISDYCERLLAPSTPSLAQNGTVGARTASGGTSVTLGQFQSHRTQN